MSRELATSQSVIAMSVVVGVFGDPVAVGVADAPSPSCPVAMAATTDTSALISSGRLSIHEVREERLLLCRQRPERDDLVMV